MARTTGEPRLRAVLLAVDHRWRAGYGPVGRWRLEHARWQTTDRVAVARLDGLDELLRRLGRTVARTGR